MVPDEPGYLPSAGDQIGGFTLLDPIGHGAMGQVYRAHDETLGREVAIKFIDISGLNNENLINQVKKRFIREARVLAAVNHPNVVEIFTASLGFRCPYIVMQYFEGMPLFEYQDSVGAVDFKRCCVISLQICEALDYCWENYQIMHRDLKPANILIDQTGHIKIIDWGIAKVTKDVTMDASFVTKADMRLGTPYFMAPEQQINPGEVTHLADIYSMGMIMWQMLTGELPFTAKSEAVIFSQKQKGPERNLTDQIPELPGSVAEIIYQMLEADPAKRLSSYAEIRNTLQTEINTFTDRDNLFPKRVVLKASKFQDSTSAPPAPSPEPVPAKPAPTPEPVVAKPVIAKPVVAKPVPPAKPVAAKPVPDKPAPSLKVSLPPKAPAAKPIPLRKPTSETAPVKEPSTPDTVEPKPPQAKAVPPEPRATTPSHSSDVQPPSAKPTPATPPPKKAATPAIAKPVPKPPTPAGLTDSDDLPVLEPLPKPKRHPLRNTVVAKRNRDESSDRILKKPEPEPDDADSEEVVSEKAPVGAPSPSSGKSTPPIELQDLPPLQDLNQGTETTIANSPQKSDNEEEPVHTETKPSLRPDIGIPKAIQVAGPEAAFGSDLIEPKPPTEQIKQIKLVKPTATATATIPAPYLQLIRLLDSQSVDKELWSGKELGRYQIVERLGMGSLGVVFRAEDTKEHCDVSLKALICDPDSVRNRVSEIQETESRFEELKHQSITPARRCSSIDGYSVLISELHLGSDGIPVNLLETCRAYGNNEGLLNQYDARSMMLIVLDALQHAHSLGLAHGNLKPENIIFPPNNGTRRKWYSDLKITDLGVVSIVGPELYNSLVKKALYYVNVVSHMRDDIRAMIRSYEFMSPETRAHGTVSPVSDVYSLGIMILALLTGRTSLKMGMKPSTMRTGISQEWDHIIIKSLREDPSKRYQSAEEMATDIANLPF